MHTAATTQTGWTGLKSLYNNVATTVESVAKEQGIALDLTGGAQRSGASAGYGGGGSAGYGGGGSAGYGGGGYDGGGSHYSNGANGGGGNFSGFDDGAANGNSGAWDEWDKPAAAAAPPSRSGASGMSRTSSGGQSNYHRSNSTPALQQTKQVAKAEEDDWGKW